MSLNLLATETASVKRAQISGGRRGTPTTVISNLRCTPLMPADPGRVNALLQHSKSNAPYRMLETMVLGDQPILAGDTLVMDGDSYTVRAVANWKPGRFSSRPFTHLTVEEIPA